MTSLDYHTLQHPHGEHRARAVVEPSTCVSTCLSTCLSTYLSACLCATTVLHPHVRQRQCHHPSKLPAQKLQPSATHHELVTRSKPRAPSAQEPPNHHHKTPIVKAWPRPSFFSTPTVKFCENKQIHIKVIPTKIIILHTWLHRKK